MKAKIVRVRWRYKTLYAVRFEGVDGVETEICLKETVAECQKVISEFKGINSPEVAPLAAITSAIALHSILPLALAIASANNEQGTENYATKHHMNNWGQQILEIASMSLEHIASHTRAYKAAPDASDRSGITPDEVDELKRTLD